MQEKKRIPLKRLHRLRNARKQAAETDDLTPMMKAIKAVHSVTAPALPSRRTWNASVPPRSCLPVWLPPTC